MPEVIVTISIAFAITYLAIPVVIHIAHTKKLYDIPDERKLHTHTIASLGGVGIFLGFIISNLLMNNLNSYPEIQYLLAAALIIFFTGLKDDIIILSATKKFLAQVVAAAIIIHLAGIKIDNLHGILGINNIPAPYTTVLSYVTIILIINAYNLIDGVDGLAGSLGMFAMLSFGSYFALAHLTAYAILSFSLAASIMAFLIFNYSPAKIFMGDSGSLLIGMFCAVLVLKFINVGSSEGAVVPVASAVAIGVCILIVPLMDTLRVFSIRIIKGRSPFSPDRNHVHHLLLDRGLSHSSVTLICVLTTIVLSITLYALRHLGNTILLLGLFSLLSCVLAILYYTLPKRKMVIHRRYTLNKVRSMKSTTPKVISLSAKESAKIEQL